MGIAYIVLIPKIIDRVGYRKSRVLVILKSNISDDDQKYWNKKLQQNNKYKVKMLEELIRGAEAA